jgi:hypothetical protein
MVTPTQEQIEEIAQYIEIVSHLAVSICKYKMQEGIFSIEESYYLFREMLCDMVVYCMRCLEIEETKQSRSDGTSSA